MLDELAVTYLACLVSLVGVFVLLYAALATLPCFRRRRRLLRFFEPFKLSAVLSAVSAVVAICAVAQSLTGHPQEQLAVALLSVGILLSIAFHTLVFGWLLVLDEEWRRSRYAHSEPKYWPWE